MSAKKFQRCSECRALNEPRALFCSRCGASLYGPVHGGIRRKRRRATAAGAAVGFAALLVLAAAIFLFAILIDRALTTTEEVDIFAGQVGTSATITTTPLSSTGGATTSTLPATNGTATQIRPTAAVASSTLKATSTNNYGVTNLLDGDLATAWNEGAEGGGIGEWVEFSFTQEVVLARIEIANGYQKDDDRYAGNPRVKSVKVEYSNGTAQLVDLLDDTSTQTITPTRQPVTSVRLTIMSVYDGQEWDDTALSEVRFYEAVN